jgi:hypothetical protein
MNKELKAISLQFPNLLDMDVININEFNALEPDLKNKFLSNFTKDQEVVNFFGEECELYFEELPEESQAAIGHSSELMQLLLSKEECQLELFYYYDDFKKVITEKLTRDVALLKAATKLRPILIAAFDPSIITTDIYLAALNHEWADNQGDWDIITSSLNTSNIDNKFVGMFLEDNELGCSNIFQIIKTASHKCLTIGSIIDLLNALVSEINFNTNQNIDQNGFLYDDEDFHYHWTMHLRWENFVFFIKHQDLLRDAEIISCLNNLNKALKNHFDALDAADKIGFIPFGTSMEDSQNVVDQWVDGLQELIDVSERK